MVKWGRGDCWPFCTPESRTDGGFRTHCPVRMSGGTRQKGSVPSVRCPVFPVWAQRQGSANLHLKGVEIGQVCPAHVAHTVGGRDTQQEEGGRALSGYRVGYSGFRKTKNPAKPETLLPNS